MSALEERLSAFLDGELSQDDARQVEAALASDPKLQLELERLMAADTHAIQEFDAMAQEPVPLALAAAIRHAPGPDLQKPAIATPRRTSGWMVAAAASVALVVGGTGGFFAGQSATEQQVAAAPGWLVDIADYHAVYAAQTRHLVEVGADESDHIVTWLTASLGAQVAIPDLSEHGLTFQGARLLVAAGKPVSQLMYQDADGRVVALCQIQTAAPRDGFATQALGGFQMVSWGGVDSNFVLVSDEGRDGMDAVAQSAAQQV